MEDISTDFISISETRLKALKILAIQEDRTVSSILEELLDLGYEAKDYCVKQGVEILSFVNDLRGDIENREADEITYNSRIPRDR